MSPTEPTVGIQGQIQKLRQCVTKTVLSSLHTYPPWMLSTVASAPAMTFGQLMGYWFTVLHPLAFFLSRCYLCKERISDAQVNMSLCWHECKTCTVHRYFLIHGLFCFSPSKQCCTTDSRLAVHNDIRNWYNHCYEHTIIGFSNYPVHSLMSSTFQLY